MSEVLSASRAGSLLILVLLVGCGAQEAAPPRSTASPVGLPAASAAGDAGATEPASWAPESPAASADEA